MNLKSYLKYSQAEYPSITEADIDRIIAQACNLPRMELFLNGDREISPAEKLKIEVFLQRRAENEPLQYIFEEAPFRDLTLNVGPGVLIPRPETEMLVDLALADLPENAEICDIGTGSGAISISLALARPDSSVTAVDICNDALAYARRNIEKYHVENITLMRSDLFSEIKEMKFDLITANLPYVAMGLYAKLDCEVRSFEPESALVSGEDGLELIRKLGTRAQKHLTSGGRIIFEFSPEQEQAMLAIMQDNNYTEVRIIKDLNQLARFAIGKL